MKRISVTSGVECTVNGFAKPGGYFTYQLEKSFTSNPEHVWVCVGVFVCTRFT